MTIQDIQKDIQEGIPSKVPPAKPYDPSVNHAPKRKQILSKEEEKLALKNALRYFPSEQHAELLPDLNTNWKLTVEFICTVIVQIINCTPETLRNILGNVTKRKPSCS